MTDEKFKEIQEVRENIKNVKVKIERLEMTKAKGECFYFDDSYSKVLVSDLLPNLPDILIGILNSRLQELEERYKEM